MSRVIINEFELVPAPSETGEASPGGAPEGGLATAPARSPVQEAERLLRRRVKRALRVWAH